MIEVYFIGIMGIMVSLQNIWKWFNTVVLWD